MAAVSLLNPKAEIARAAQALGINITGAMGLQKLMATNLGPKGTTKMLVSPAGDIRITKDGNVLLNEMNIRHPTANMIARASTAQDDSLGDGTTSTVLLIGELLKQAELLIAEGLHPRLLVEGIMLAKKHALEVLESLKIPTLIEREALIPVARTSLRTKLEPDLADMLTDICVDAVLAVRGDGKDLLDLNMIELMEMLQHTCVETQLVEGLVLDHGGRHVNMPKILQDAYILTCNVSLELEKTSVTSGFYYKTAVELDKCVTEEHRFIDLRLAKIIELKKKVCAGNEKGFVVINQKGIDVPSLEVLANEGILGLRRAKRRNMERLVRACGGEALNSLEDLKEEHLGFAALVREEELGETKYTFVEHCRNPTSVTIVIRGQARHQISAIKDAIRDGLHAIQNAVLDACVVPGAGAFEMKAHKELLNAKHSVKGKAQLGVQLFAEALLVIPKTLATNSGFDVQDTIVKLTDAQRETEGSVGLDLATGEPMDPTSIGILDNFCVRRQILDSCSIIASNLLLTDEIMQAGMTSLKG
ncbi:T-complex protein 1 subunit zeta-like [Drosophila rhopaloa]|uniref:T-complex protein 1 subunit zeta n=1 Tax=Drosophila rhopaloa TaxID=1041015 RepID=A0ABM5J7L0_DRORH|nr:T-complex protein 1 subunit zeta-like [Drosophila rhopaloa]